MKPVKTDTELFSYEKYIGTSIMTNLDESLAWLGLMDQMEKVLGIADWMNE